MLECKTFEVRDRGTFIPCVGVRCAPQGSQLQVHQDWPPPSPPLVVGYTPQTADGYLLRRSGYSQGLLVLFGRLEGGQFCYDPYDRSDCARTMRIAHDYVADHWDELQSGAVVDVEFVLGETSAPKLSEAVTT